MSKILISGCGITFPGERPTWVSVLKLCKLNIVDLSGPAISNYLILNQLLLELKQNTYTHVVCQLTGYGKLDVQINADNQELVEKDTLRNFTYRGYWPSSASDEHIAKQHYYKYLYSPDLERQDIELKIDHLQMLCEKTNTKLHVIQGYDIGLDAYNIYEDYKQDPTYAYHDYSNSNTVPCRQFQVKLADKINKEFLKQHIPIEKFYE